ncbi:SigE family RNA polymerase sigma factor [Streptomyces radicis]|uniref:SigE family RNA polymerase sigma factor n=1 Tax=Streptomyces radicis TaxID=1750517 RepID=A0A3A9WIJ9_9ACTN|nr:SigE family RNA polymerase sigma factor [Streptomyces radicis]RKN07536.1 SigE family RNA polymerase sigma factor [Streptomyces radicis]RKN13667.1 SigE family RNA polymerase sigma factor [Streptomyces radicis]
MRTEEVDTFHGFVRSRWAGLVRTAYLLTGDRHLAEDVAQTALAKAYRSWPRVMRSDNPDAYVRRILVSCHRDRFRKRRVPEHLMDVPPEAIAAQDDMARADERDRLAAALARLPMRQRAVVVLRYWEDLSEAEVAQTLGCSIGTVKSQASKALSKLRATLGQGQIATVP